MEWEAVKMFNEIYSAYYNAVAAILKAASREPLTDQKIRNIVEEKAFEESILNILPALKDERWPLLNAKGESILVHDPEMPLTYLQKQWLMAISLDPRIQLFGESIINFPEVEPLFLPEDYRIIDQYSDGDAYENEEYRAVFRTILDAVNHKYPLDITHKNKKGNRIKTTIMPEYLEYSEKDDKFRLIGSGSRFYETLNIGRIIECKPCQSAFLPANEKRNFDRQGCVIFELADYRNALERALMHFAHFEKQAERIDDKKYRITVHYDKDDETELVIRILSFGPLIRVVEPGHFINLIRERLIQQKRCGNI